MGTVEKVALAIVGVAFATTLVLNDRKTEQVVKAFGGIFTGGLRQAMGMK